ncbi:Threonine dehydrogenase and related Zn-dependent dehydrogenase [Thioalkalivibrio nitratireducens DSM 14787]|uniref:Threonine dehydrogenase and related Zn-dependent dehydrogenase n=1 Tax=Thioalkalivibrio nitratireducens (strain DSM 14787 / UNIQEM 213 / ALEN2) TaxID=1255043 RepID=L0DWX3_THIND|nr:zinc-binding alcohol dehydrogenase [Thioalkalivibrio nitratireducens]AGA33455.1 Threonine dehydrogenase and related Zn-dependent dehydrogenase [Thioalkalivibrio nitratireducens DSM 14787]
MRAASKTARAFWVLGPGRGELREESLPDAGPDDVLVRTLFSGISRGTEALVFTGRVPESQRTAMRAPFQAGEFPGPVKYGYINVGRIEEGPAERIGEHVFCLYPHQDLYRVPGAAAIRLPEGLPPERAVLAANMETAVNAFWDAAPLAGDRILVIGGGVLGLLTAWLCGRVPGTEVTLVDTNPRRDRFAAALGLEFRDAPVEHMNADLVIHASGQPEGLVQALGAAAIEATVLELSWYGDRMVALPLGEAFHSRRLVLRSSQVGRIPAARAARWDHARRIRLALELLRDERIDPLVTGEDGFADLPWVIARLASDPGDTLCHRVRYP